MFLMILSAWLLLALTLMFLMILSTWLLLVLTVMFLMMLFTWLLLVQTVTFLMMLSSWLLLDLTVMFLMVLFTWLLLVLMTEMFLMMLSSWLLLDLTVMFLFPNDAIYLIVTSTDGNVPYDWNPHVWMCLETEWKDWDANVEHWYHPDNLKVNLNLNPDTGCSLNIVFFSFRCCDFSELYQFCCSAGFLPAWCVYSVHTLTPRENRVRQESGIF